MSITEGDRLSPMPTPHSRRLHRRGPRVVVVTFLLLVLPFLALELGIRALIATDRLPTAPSHSEQLDIGLVHLRGIKPQDVLLMGDSQAATGFEPAVLKELLEAELGRKVPVYNFGQPGSTTSSNWLTLDLIAREGRMPDVVVFDISVSALVPRGNQRPGGVGLRLDNGAIALLDSALGRELTGCNREEEIVDRIDCGLARVSAAWRWHGRPERIFQAVVSGNELRLKEARGKLRRDGFFARIPATQAQIAQQVEKADFAEDRVTLGVNQREADDLRAFAEAVESRGGQVIFVQVPLTRPYTDELIARSPDWESERRAAADALEAAIGRDIVYVERYGDWWSERSASDLNHLSADGAKDFTRQLWEQEDFRRQLVAALGGEGAGGSPSPSSSPAASAPPSSVPASTAPASPSGA